MVGVGKLLKQAQKMQKRMEEVQGELADHFIDVSSGGGAVKIRINGQGEFQAISFDPEFLKEDPEFVAEVTLQVIRDAAEQAKKRGEEAMGGLAGGLDMGGLPGLF